MPVVSTMMVWTVNDAQMWENSHIIWPNKFVLINDNSKYIFSIISCRFTDSHPNWKRPMLQSNFLTLTDFHYIFSAFTAIKKKVIQICVAFRMVFTRFVFWRWRRIQIVWRRPTLVASLLIVCIGLCILFNFELIILKPFDTHALHMYIVYIYTKPASMWIELTEYPSIKCAQFLIIAIFFLLNIIFL